MAPAASSIKESTTRTTGLRQKALRRAATTKLTSCPASGPSSSSAALDSFRAAEDFRDEACNTPAGEWSSTNASASGSGTGGTSGGTKTNGGSGSGAPSTADGALAALSPDSVSCAGATGLMGNSSAGYSVGVSASGAPRSGAAAGSPRRASTGSSYPVGSPEEAGRPANPSGKFGEDGTTATPPSAAPSLPAAGILGTLCGRQANGVRPTNLKSSPDAAAPPTAERNAGTAACGTSSTGVPAVGSGSVTPKPIAGPAAGKSENSALPWAKGCTCADAAAGGGGEESPQGFAASDLRATAMGGARRSASDTSGNSAEGAGASKCADASKTSLH